MLYLVQMIVSGAVEPPHIFADQIAAQEAFTALVREHGATEYSDYCTAREIAAEAFTSAKTYADAGSSGNRLFCYWELTPESDGVTEQQLSLPEKSREPIIKAAAETQQQVLGVQTELRDLTEKLADMSQELIRLQDLISESAEANEPTDTPELPQPAPDVLDEKYQTPEWQAFIQSLIQMCGGNFGEFPLLSRQDWRQAVYSSNTTLQYWEWVAITIDQSIEAAKTNGYTIEEDSQQNGHFAYICPDGERSPTLYEMEDLAWCAAGLHAAQADDAQA